jgi:hypothetical protein
VQFGEKDMSMENKIYNRKQRLLVWSIALFLLHFVLSREFFNFENMWVYSSSTLLKQNILFSDRNAYWSMAAIGQWCF